MLMNPMLNIAIQAIRQAGNFVIRQYELCNINNITTIEHKNNLLTKINKHTTHIIKNIITKYYPKHNIISQKTYNHDKKNNKIQWVINPLNGAMNFIRHFPYFSLSIAIKIKEQTEIAVIYDPVHNDLFSAIRGKGTQLNGHRIHHSCITKKTLYEELIVTCFPHVKQHAIISILNKINQKTITHFRCSGSITLDLAYVAAGRIDGLFAINIKTYKLEHTSLLIQEAGGLILNINKNNNVHQNTYKNVIAGHPKFIKLLIEKSQNQNILNKIL